MQELLLALLGLDGLIFQEKNKEKFQTCRGVFSPCDEPMIERILEIASHYSCILKFYKSKSEPEGKYRAALQAGLHEATEKYRQEIVSLESEVLSQPQLGLTHLYTRLHSHAPILKRIALMIQQVIAEEAHGCAILDVVHQHTVHHSVLHTKDIMHRIEQRVHSVLYDQLAQWLLYGTLLDPHQEFFLQFSDADKQQIGDAPSISVCPPLLPNHIPAALAHKVLFVGQAVRDFEGKERRDDAAIGLLSSKENDFLQQISNLKMSSCFSLDLLTTTVESIRATVSQHLYSVVMKGGLLKTLDELKQIMLLGRGELYHTFFESASALLDGPVSTIANVNLVFQTSGEMVQIEEEFLDRFTVKCSEDALKLMPQVVADTSRHAGTGWSSLLIHYNSPAVLRQILSSDSIKKKYQVLFSFLLCVSRVQHRLHTCWITHLKNSKTDEDLQERTAWTLRHHMTLLVDGLQYYLQVDVLEAHHYQFISNVMSSEDYQQVQVLLSGCLSTIVTHCFINQQLVSKCFSAIFSLCHQLCDQMQSKESLTTESTAAINEGFSDCCRRLFRTLSRLQQLPGQQQHTASLLARIDYNDFYRTKYLKKNSTD